MAGVAIAVSGISSCTSRLALPRACINPFRLQSGPVFMILCQREMAPSAGFRAARELRPLAARPALPGAGLACEPRPQPGRQGAAHLREHPAVIGTTFPDHRTTGHHPPDAARAAKQSSYSLGAVSVWESIGMFRSPARCGLSRLQGIPVSAGNRMFDRTGRRTGNRAGSLIPRSEPGIPLTAAKRKWSRLRNTISRREFRMADVSVPFLVRGIVFAGWPGRARVPAATWAAGEGAGVRSASMRIPRRRPAACEHVVRRGKTSPRGSSPASDGSSSIGAKDVSTCGYRRHQ